MVSVEQFGDLGEGEAEAAQRDDVVQSPHVVAGVAAVPRTVVQRRGQQADLVVMVQRADGQAGLFGQFAHAPGAFFVHGNRR